MPLESEYSPLSNGSANAKARPGDLVNWPLLCDLDGLATGGDGSILLTILADVTIIVNLD